MRKHPAWGDPVDGHVPALKERSIPIGGHGDKGQHIKQSKVLVLSWGSCCTRQRLVFTMIPEELMHDNETLDDLAAEFVWSLHVL